MQPQYIKPQEDNPGPGTFAGFQGVSWVMAQTWPAMLLGLLRDTADRFSNKWKQRPTFAQGYWQQVPPASESLRTYGSLPLSPPTTGEKLKALEAWPGSIWRDLMWYINSWGSAVLQMIQKRYIVLREQEIGEERGPEGL